jgi:hypothetical protein
MTVSHRSDSFTPRPRSDGPPGIDWTHAAPDCPACWRAWLAGDLPIGPLLSRRTHAGLAAATLALSLTAPAAALASEPYHRSTAGPHDSDPLDPVVETPGDDSASAPVGGDPEPPAPDPDGPGDDASPAPEPVTQVPETAPDAPDAPVDAESDPPPTDDADPAPEAPVTPPEGGPSPPPPTADQSGPSDTAPASGMNRDPSQLERHTLYIARSARSHRSSKISAPARTSAAAPPRTVIRVVDSGVATAVPPAGRAQPGHRSHVVRPGESLWSIASEVLGGRASSALVAAEVRRLWQLNGRHIGSGDPDLLAVGTRLILR